MGGLDHESAGSASGGTLCACQPESHVGPQSSAELKPSVTAQNPLASFEADDFLALPLSRYF